MKRARQAEILNIIREIPVDTQEQLLAQLSQRGYSATQATISRDIKELQLVKELSGGQYRYVASLRRAEGGTSNRLQSIFRQGVLTVEVAQNIVVVKTMPGLASAACSALDNMDIDGMVGSLAGDDTGILIMEDSETAKVFGSQVHKLLE